MPARPTKICSGRRRYRLLAALPVKVDFPAIAFQVEAGFVVGSGAWRLVARAGPREWFLAEFATRDELERAVAKGFGLPHPSAPATILDRLCREGRAERVS